MASLAVWLSLAAAGDGATHGFGASARLASCLASSRDDARPLFDVGCATNALGGRGEADGLEQSARFAALVQAAPSALSPAAHADGWCVRPFRPRAVRSPAPHLRALPRPVPPPAPCARRALLRASRGCR